MFRPLHIAALLCALAPAAAVAQQADIAFGGLKQDTTLPVEVKADSLAVNQADGSATFTGNVLVGQGEMRLSAQTVRVEYGADGKGIARLHASGKVTLASPTDAAEANEAVYTLDAGSVVMTGNVLLTQGKSAISGNRLTIDLKAGTGRMEGGVSTIFVPGGN